MKKKILILMALLSSLSMNAQYFFFDKLEEVDTIGKNSFKYLHFYNEELIEPTKSHGTEWRFIMDKEELTPEQVKRLRDIFLRMSTKGNVRDFNHYEYHQDGRDTISIDGYATGKDNVDAPFNFYGRIMSGGLGLREDLRVVDNHAWCGVYSSYNPIDNHLPPLKGNSKDTTRMEQAFQTLLKKYQHTSREETYTKDNWYRAGQSLVNTCVVRDSFPTTHAIVYELNTTGQDAYHELISVMNEHFGTHEFRFELQEHRLFYEADMIMGNSVWSVCIYQGKTYLLRASQESAIFVPLFWFIPKGELDRTFMTEYHKELFFQYFRPFNTVKPRYNVFYYHQYQ